MGTLLRMHCQRVMIALRRHVFVGLCPSVLLQAAHGVHAGVQHAVGGPRRRAGAAPSGRRAAPTAAAAARTAIAASLLSLLFNSPVSSFMIIHISLLMRLVVFANYKHPSLKRESAV